jgi:hypothetical protein
LNLVSSLRKNGDPPDFGDGFDVDMNEDEFCVDEAADVSEFLNTIE